MQFAAIVVTSCKIPETCQDFGVAGIQVRRDPTIVCLRLKKHVPTTGTESDTWSNINQFDATAIDGASLKEKMDLLDRFAAKNQLAKVWAEAESNQEF